MSKKSLPKWGMILNYENVIEDAMPVDRIEILKNCGISKEEILCRLAMINSFLSPRLSARFDYSKATQVKILDSLLRLDIDHPAINIFRKKISDNTMIFNRPSNLFAMMEIMGSDIESDNGEGDGSVNSIQELDFFRYYLCVNHETNQLNESVDTTDPSFAELNASVMAHNELFENIDPIHTAYRGKRLFKYIIDKSEYVDDFKDYINQISGLDLKEYLVELMSIFFSNNSSREEFNIHFKLEENNDLFNSFSERSDLNENSNKLEALDIRKSPIYRISKENYILLDNKFLMEKCYNLIIWDFVFEKLLIDKNQKERGNIIKSYRSMIGYFFEDYVREKIENSLPYLKHPKPKLFDDLVVGGKEIGDVYIRQNKHVLLGEVKSSGIPSKSKYGESLADLYGISKEKFFKIHGLDQLVNNLGNLFDNPLEYDSNLDISKKHSIFPVIITNEVSLTVGLMIHLFNEEFDLRFDRSNYPNHEIKPLMILHISDLEFLEEYLKVKKIKLFDFLNNHIKRFSMIPKLSMSYDMYAPKYSPNIGELIFGEND